MATPVYDAASIRPAQPTAIDRAAVALNKFPSKAAFALIGLGLLAIVIGCAGVRSATIGSGATEVVDLRAQLPYLMSGGIGGLALVITGCALLVVQSHRTDAARLQATMAALVAHQVASSALTAPAPDDVAGLVVAGTASYHLPTCRLVEGRADQSYLLPSEAQNRGLTACRVCNPESY